MSGQQQQREEARTTDHEGAAIAAVKNAKKNKNKKQKKSNWPLHKLVACATPSCGPRTNWACIRIHSIHKLCEIIGYLRGLISSVPQNRHIICGQLLNIEVADISFPSSRPRLTRLIARPNQRAVSPPPRRPLAHYHPFYTQFACLQNDTSAPNSSMPHSQQLTSDRSAAIGSAPVAAPDCSSRRSRPLPCPPA